MKKLDILGDNAVSVCQIYFVHVRFCFWIRDSVRLESVTCSISNIVFLLFVCCYVANLLSLGWLVVTFLTCSHVADLLSCCWLVVMLLTCCHVADLLLPWHRSHATCCLHGCLQNLSNEEQVVVIHARTVLTLAEKVTQFLLINNTEWFSTLKTNCV